MVEGHGATGGREVCVGGVELEEVSKKLPQEGSLAKECLASRLYFVCTCVREHACAECPALTHVMCVRPNHASGVTRSRSSVSIKGGKGATFKSETIFRNASPVKHHARKVAAWRPAPKRQGLT